MLQPKLSRLEFRIMSVLWSLGPSSIREIHEQFPKRGRPAYTSVQTMVYRLEAKGALRRAKKISNAHIFEAAITKDLAHRRVIDDVLAFFGGRGSAVMAKLIETGALTLEDIREAEKALREAAKEKP